MLSHDYLPEDDVRLVRSVTVDASPEATYQAIAPATIGDDQLLAVTTWLSELPERALSFFQRQEADTLPAETTIGDLIERHDVVPLAQAPGRELLVGALGRFWNPIEVLEDVDPHRFRTYDEPGSARGVVSFSLHERHADHCLLVLEARAKATDASARQRLTRWARFVRPVVGLFARRVLDVIKAQAEAQADGGPAPALPDPTSAAIATASGAMVTLDDVDVTDRRVLLRVDVNEPVQEGLLTGRRRLQAAASTISTLLDEDAGVAVLAHQGRPGREDFTDLAQHAEILAELVDHPIRHVEAVEDPEATRALQALQPGEGLVLGNVRGAEGEVEDVDPALHARRGWVKALAEHADLYVNDAFPACHRSHASIVGLPRLLPAVAGPRLVAELEVLDRVGEQAQPRVAVLGGAKPGKTLAAIAHQLARERVDEVLVGGLLAAAFLEADGVDTGQGTRAVLAEHGYREHARQASALLDTYRSRIQLPTDVAIHREGDRLELPVEELPAPGRILDIGPATANSFADRVTGAGTVLVHGPLGVYEDTPFGQGTRRVFAAASKGSGYAVIGGGHTVHAMSELGVDERGFDHVSLAGGALLASLAGEKLPGVEALRASGGARPD